VQRYGGLKEAQTWHIPNFVLGLGLVAEQQQVLPYLCLGTVYFMDGFLDGFLYFQCLWVGGSVLRPGKLHFWRVIFIKYSEKHVLCASYLVTA
jgi:hypothetical protein